MYSSVLVALDGSEPAAAAIPYALEMAQAFAARLILLRVLLHDTAFGALSAEPGPLSLARREYDARRSQAEGYLESLKRSLGTKGVPVECLIRDGEPAATILETAGSLGQSLIVITAYGKMASLTRGGLGSVAKDVLREANGPVLLVRLCSNFE